MAKMIEYFQDKLGLADSLINTIKEIEANNLTGCRIYYRTKFDKLCRKNKRCEHIIKIKLKRDQDLYWSKKQIKQINHWLESNCENYYKFIVVPSVRFLEGYSINKENRIMFSNQRDAMAFKLWWF